MMTDQSLHYTGKKWDRLEWICYLSVYRGLGLKDLSYDWVSELSRLHQTYFTYTTKQYDTNFSCLQDRSEHKVLVFEFNLNVCCSFSVFPA